MHRGAFNAARKDQSAAASKRIVVGVADMKVSNHPEDLLVTHALGSCIALAVYDPRAMVGGILHYLLPDSSLDFLKAQKHPYIFADTGIPRLFKECYSLGAEKRRTLVKVAGGGQILGEHEPFNIGRRNYAALRKIFLKNNVLIGNEDVGGTKPRTMYLEIATGRVWVKTTGKEIIEL